MNFAETYDKLIEKFANPERNAPLPEDYLIEECAELTQAIIHLKRGRGGAMRELISEMAHVYTMIDSTRCFYLIGREEIYAEQQKLIDRYLGQPNDGRHVEAV